MPLIHMPLFNIVLYILQLKYHFPSVQFHIIYFLTHITHFQLLFTIYSPHILIHLNIINIFINYKLNQS